jgi:hypothetical protein
MTDAGAQLDAQDLQQATDFISQVDAFAQQRSALDSIVRM